VIGYSDRTTGPVAITGIFDRKIMASRINRAIELLQQDQAIYYTGGHSGHVLSYPQGCKDAQVWADYINIGMEHGAFDMTGLAEYMRGLVEGGPTRSGHRTPAIIVEAPVNGTNAANARFNAWQFRQILGRGVHGVLLCQAESADAVRETARCFCGTQQRHARALPSSRAGRGHAGPTGSSSARPKSPGPNSAKPSPGTARISPQWATPSGLSSLAPSNSSPFGLSGQTSQRPR
jgi:hypothetical protein